MAKKKRARPLSNEEASALCQRIAKQESEWLKAWNTLIVEHCRNVFVSMAYFMDVTSPTKKWRDLLVEHNVSSDREIIEYYRLYLIGHNWKDLKEYNASGASFRTYIRRKVQGVMSNKRRDIKKAYDALPERLGSNYIDLGDDSPASWERIWAEIKATFTEDEIHLLLLSYGKELSKEELDALSEKLIEEEWFRLQSARGKGLSNTAIGIVFGIDKGKVGELIEQVLIKLNTAAYKIINEDTIIPVDDVYPQIIQTTDPILPVALLMLDVIRGRIVAKSEVERPVYAALASAIGVAEEGADRPWKVFSVRGARQLDYELWTAVFNDLKAQRFDTVNLLITHDYPGLESVVSARFNNASWQACYNRLKHACWAEVPKPERRAMQTLLNKIFSADSLSEANAIINAVPANDPKRMVLEETLRPRLERAFTIHELLPRAVQTAVRKRLTTTAALHALPYRNQYRDCTGTVVNLQSPYREGFADYFTTMLHRYAPYSETDFWVNLRAWVRGYEQTRNKNMKQPYLRHKVYEAIINLPPARLL